MTIVTLAGYVPPAADLRAQKSVLQRTLGPNTTTEWIPVLHRPSTPGAAAVIFIRCDGSRAHT